MLLFDHWDQVLERLTGPPTEAFPKRAAPLERAEDMRQATVRPRQTELLVMTPSPASRGVHRTCRARAIGLCDVGRPPRRWPRRPLDPLAGNC